MKDSVKTIALRTGTILHAIISTFSKDNLRYELNETKLFWTLSAVMDFDGGIYLWVCEHVAESVINANQLLLYQEDESSKDLKSGKKNKHDEENKNNNFPK